MALRYLVNSPVDCIDEFVDVGRWQSVEQRNQLYKIASPIHMTNQFVPHLTHASIDILVAGVILWAFDLIWGGLANLLIR